MQMWLIMVKRGRKLLTKWGKKSSKWVKMVKKYFMLTLFKLFIKKSKISHEDICF